MPVALTHIPEALRPRLLAHLLTHSEFDPATNCITYTGYCTPKGYGRQAFTVGSEVIRVRIHRAVWILSHGPIEDDSLVVDHTCGHRSCINPGHLALITNEENLHRGDDRQGRSRRQFGRYLVKKEPRLPARDRPFCVNGHPWPEFQRNRRSKSGGQEVYCSECQRQRRRALDPTSRPETLPR